MAGSSDSNGNPVAINVVPMVDVIFCLCVFFMCSFRFRGIEGKLDAWLPKTLGIGGPATRPLVDEIRVVLSPDPETRNVRRMLGSRRVASNDELAGLLREARDDRRRLDPAADVSVTID